jgi:hypothetical protein
MLGEQVVLFLGGGRVSASTGVLDGNEILIV